MIISQINNRGRCKRGVFESATGRESASERERERERDKEKERERERERKQKEWRARACASERAGHRRARSRFVHARTNERTNAYAQAPNESAVLKTAVAETSAKRRLGELNVRSAKLLFFRIAREAPSRGNIRGDYHDDYCIR